MLNLLRNKRDYHVAMLRRKARLKEHEHDAATSGSFGERGRTRSTPLQLIADLLKEETSLTGIKSDWPAGLSPGRSPYLGATFRTPR